MLRQFRFTLVLGALLLLTVVSPFVMLIDSVAARLMVALSFGLVLFSLVHSVSRLRAMAVFGGSWAGLVIVIQIVNSVGRYDSLTILNNLLSAGLIAWCVCLMISFLFTDQSVSRETISASLCGFLLLGVFWANLYSFMAFFDAEAFRGPGITQTGELRFGDERTGTALYFSFVTLTTLGYGDIVPATMPARMLCSVQALTGQLYLAVLVARLVGLHIAYRKP